MRKHTALPTRPGYLRAIRIDPDRCSVELIEVEPGEVAAILRSELIETIDYETGHCLVIDDGGSANDHPTRFRFTSGELQRPFFGPALILGLEHGNWASASLEPGPVRTHIVWEEWDQRKQRYAEPAMETV